MIIGDVFSSRQQLIELGLHSEPQRGMGSKTNDKGVDYIFSIVMNNYPDNQFNEDEIYYSGEGGFDSITGTIKSDQSLQTSANKKMISSIRLRAEIMVFIKSQKGFEYKGKYIPTHYKKIRGRNGFIIIDFHLIKAQKVIDYEVDKNTKSVFIVFENGLGFPERVELKYPENQCFLGYKILNSVEYNGKKSKIYNII
jgi:hypothetical protein